MKSFSFLRYTFACALFILCNRADAVTIYVDIAASGSNNGTSWTNAYTSPQSALAASVSGDSIFIATGTYKPDVTAPGNRNLSFNMKTGVVLVGGFPTGGSTLASRNWVTNPTILSGDIGTIGTHTDNSYHVVRCAGQQGELNGFIVERGRADAAAPDNDGGGVFITSGYLMSRFCTYRNNFATDQGGGSYHDAGGNPQYRQCRFENNSAASGGGSYAFASTIIANCSYIGNAATSNGGGVYAVVNINMYNNTFRTNSAVTSGNAIYYQSGGSNRLFNSIVWGNTGSATHIAGAGSIQLHYCIIQGGCPGGGATCNTILNLDPLFSDAAGHIPASSPAVDAGDVTSPDFNNNSLTIDLDNNNRNFDAVPGGGIRDIGAYENQIANLTRYYVDHTATGANDGTSWVNAFTSFQSAVAIAAGGDTVLVAAGTHKPSVGPSRLKKYNLVNGVCYYGGFPNGGGTFAQRDFTANRTVLSGDIGTLNDSTDNCFVVIDATDLSALTLMSGFTVERGNADSTCCSNMYSLSGGIYMNNGAMRLDSVTVRNNYGGAGSAVYTQTPVGWTVRGCTFEYNKGNTVFIGTGGSGTFLNCTFRNNTGTQGAAINISSVFAFTGCTFTSNRATAGGGGGAVNGGAGSTFTNCIFNLNTSNGPGGAYYKFGGAPTNFIGCSFIGNSVTGGSSGGGAIMSLNGGFNADRCVFTQNAVTGSSGHGAAIYNNIGTANITNCVVWSNSTATGLGGGIYNNTSGTVNLNHCTFANNNAGGFGQGGGLNNNSNSNATVINCIFWDNTASGSNPASNTEIGHGSGTLNVSYTLWQGNSSGGTILNVNPMFVNQVAGNLALSACSHAIDTGATVAILTDVLGLNRAFDARPGTFNHDLGAYEFQATQPFPLVTGTATHVNVSCFAGSNGSIDVTPANGQGPYTFLWSPSGQTTEDRTGIPFGNYTITITDANGCTTTVTRSITQPSALSVGETHTNVPCFGGSSGGAGIGVAGGTPGYSYSWAPSGGSGSTATGLTTGTYTVTVTDANTCTSSVTFNITSPPQLVLTPMFSTNVTCNGLNNGVASVQGSGGVTPYSVDWTPGNPTGEGTYTASSLAPGTYTCTLTDGNGCTASTSFTITQPPALVVTPASETDVSCNGVPNGTASVSASGGTGTLTYSWNPGNPPGEGTNSVTGLYAAVWSCTVSDQNGCAGSASFTITQPPFFYGGLVSQTNVSCNGGNDGAATIAGNGGVSPYSYDWAPGNPSGDGTVTATGLTAGSWSCTVTDANGCTFSSTVNITQPTPVVPNASQTSVQCNGGNAVVTIAGSGGMSPYTGTGTFTVTAGTYTYTITDANGCTGTTTVVVTQPTALTAGSSATSILCNGGTATVTVIGAGGTSPYTGTGTYTVTAGTYTYPVTDANGCSATTTVVITQPAALNAASSAFSVPCNGGVTTVTVTATGGTFPYSGTGTFTVSAGTYTYTVTDANGCTSATSITVTEPPLLVATLSSPMNVTCNGGNNGSGTVNATGGTPAYAYQWFPSGGTGPTANNLTPGCYTVIVTDMNGCTASAVTCITEPTAVAVTSSATSILCNGGTSTVTVAASGGISPYTGEGTFVVTVGTYSYIVTDANGCASTTSLTITEPTALATASSATSIACNGGNATVTVAASGGTSPYTGEGTFTEIAGTYSYTVTDANGCTSTTSITVTEPTALTTTASATSILCNGGNATVTVAATGGTSPYTGEGTFTVVAGTYTYTVTDANGCTSTTTLTITEPAFLSAIVTSYSDPSGCGGTDGSIDITPAGGTIPYTFLWSNASPLEDPAGLNAGAYSCTITDANGCTATISATLNDPNAPTVTLSLAMDTLCVDDALFTLSGESPAGGTFSGPGVSGGMFDPLTAGVGTHMISYTYTDISGCTGSTTDSIYVDICLDAPSSVQGSLFTVYPNPNNGTFTLQLNSTSIADVMIYDAQGKLVKTQKVSSSNEQITIAESGMYMITVITADGHRSTQRVIVKE